MIKVLVVDDSLFMRRMISEILNKDPYASEKKQIDELYKKLKIYILRMLI